MLPSSSPSASLPPSTVSSPPHESLNGLSCPEKRRLEQPQQKALRLRGRPQPRTYIQSTIQTEGSAVHTHTHTHHAGHKYPRYLSCRCGLLSWISRILTICYLLHTTANHFFASMISSCERFLLSSCELLCASSLAKRVMIIIIIIIIIVIIIGTTGCAQLKTKPQRGAINHRTARMLPYHGQFDTILRIVMTIIGRWRGCSCRE